MPSLVPPETSEQACCLPSQEIASGPGSAWGVLPILAPYLGSLYVRDDPQSQGRGDRPGAGRLAELAQHRRDMVPDGFLGQEEPLRDFGVGKALGEQAEYLHLARRKPGRVGPARRPGTAGNGQALSVPGAQHRVAYG